MGALLRESDVRRDKCRLDKEDIHIPGKRNDRCTIGRGSLSEYILARRLILHDTIRALFRFLPVTRAPTLPAPPRPPGSPQPSAARFLMAAARR
jgi:hypothetical protein